MASSSSCSSNISINSRLVDGDVLWMQDKHISQHIWNGEEDRKLHIRRVVPVYQGQEEIPEEIIPLLRQSGFYWIMKMWLRRGNQHIGNDDLILFRRKLDIMKRHEAEVVETLQYMVSPQGRNTWTVDDLVPYVEKITILSENVETKGIARQRETVEVKPYVYPQMAERDHGMYYTPPAFSQYLAQMYQYPFEAHQSDTSIHLQANIH
ncbi:hypothetical protein GmHk_05G013379 [Glycine max]|nr:hypothetical protein GmHk_05G013379 [Glycine max]